MGRSRQSPQAALKKLHHLKQKRRKSMLRPPFDCPVCLSLRAVGVKKIEEDTMLFSCRKGCFEEEVIITQKIVEPIDGFNVVTDRMYNQSK